MEPIHLFQIAAQQQHWLSVNQSVTAGNIANANTPGYRAQAVAPFADVLDQTRLELASTSPSHLGLDAAGVQSVPLKDEDPWEVTDSGNSVSLEQEMINANDVNRGFALNTSIVKSFHGMLMASLRGAS